MAAVIVGEERYVFDCEWYDQQAELIRYYRITFYPTDQTIEMVSQTFVLYLFVIVCYFSSLIQVFFFLPNF